ncbi:MAG: hypothetical protein N2376_13720 [Clostridia bacterium]|nr:hypothetical protein [Clostridia bacterium]
MNTNNFTFSQTSLSPNAARLLSNRTKSVPMMEGITPRWLVSFLPWVAVEAGVYNVNKIRKDLTETREKAIELLTCTLHENDIPKTFPDYDENPREYTLSLIQTILKVNTNIIDIFNNPINALQEQMRLTIEAMKERQEHEIINNKDFGLINCVSPKMTLSTRRGAPTPDDMDELLAKVWKKPAFFVAHPRAIAAFGRECTRRGVPPVMVHLFGSPFMTWRGVPILPSDKLLVDGSESQGSTKILLMRVGEKEQGVIGLHQPGIPEESATPSLSVRFGGIDDKGVASYIFNLYFSAAVLTDDALGMLENVEVGNYYEYR